MTDKAPEAKGPFNKIPLSTEAIEQWTQALSSPEAKAAVTKNLEDLRAGRGESIDPALL